VAQGVGIYRQTISAGAGGSSKTSQLPEGHVAARLRARLIEHTPDQLDEADY
jgi:hypothetical protein